MQPDSPSSLQGAPRLSGVRGARYCEVFVVNRHLLRLRGKVYNTLGLNDCPGTQWSALNAERLKAEHHADAIILNGPRFFMMDAIASADVAGSETISFDGLAMRLVAVVDLPLRIRGNRQDPYTETTIERTTEYVFLGGKPVHELVAPDGRTFVMQSYSHIVDDTLTQESLASLADRLALPAGWRYQVRTPEQDLILRTAGRITVIQDELQNTYQRVTST
jgi:hypothetical protein